MFQAQRFADYTLLTRLAVGGMGELFICHRHQKTPRLLALKRILPEFSADPEFARMFADEAKLATLLRHPNIVSAYAHGQADGQTYLVLEYVEGVDVASLSLAAAQMKDPFPPAEVAAIGAHVAAGLHHAHQLTDGRGKPLNVVHRDVSPENILVSASGAVKLLDFGVAKARTAAAATSAGVRKGKIVYASPESIVGRRIDGRHDIWSLGVVLWELLAGGPIDQHVPGLMNMLLVGRNVAIPAPSAVNPDVPPEVDAIIGRALQSDPAARFQTADELAKALGGWVGQQGMAHAQAKLAVRVMRGFGAELRRRRAKLVKTITALDLAMPAQLEQAVGQPPPAPTGARTPDARLRHADPQLADARKRAALSMDRMPAIVPAPAESSPATISEAPAPAPSRRQYWLAAAAALIIVAAVLALLGA